MPSLASYLDQIAALKDRVVGLEDIEDQMAMLQAEIAASRDMGWQRSVSIAAPVTFANGSQAPFPEEELSAIFELAAWQGAADAWNQRHHALRRLPLEMFERCWSFLDTPDLLRVAFACKFWQRLIHDAPALWTDLTFRIFGYGSTNLWQHCFELGPLLKRSKRSSFGLSVTLSRPLDEDGLAVVLSPHAHRLRRLELHAHHSYSHYRPVHMEFRAPELRTFVCDLPGLSFHRDSFITSCPNLENMNVAALSLDRQARFARVTSLTCGWGGGSLNGLYDWFPRLAVLDISRVELREPLPPPDLPRDRPPPATLRRVVLRGIKLSYVDLIEFGFRSIQELEIHGATGQFDDTLALFDALGGTPRSAEIQARRVVIRADGPQRKLCVAFQLDNCDQYYTLVARVAVRTNLASLAFHEWPPAGFTECASFPADEFPALATLVLPAGCPLLDPGHMPHACGKLRAPALRRLAIIGDGAVPRALKPQSLADFVARHLELAPGRKLDELVLDGDRGVELCEPCDEGFDILHKYVSTISHTYRLQGAF